MAQKACVIGWPIKHSRSPLIHGYWLKKYGISGTYEKLAIEPKNLETFLETLTAQGFQGCNVTIPHKESCCRLVTVEDEMTRKIGAVNTIYQENGLLKGINTDGIGYMANLRMQAPQWYPRGKDATVIGAGGATRSIIVALLNNGIDSIHIFNRTLSKAKTLAVEFGPRVFANRFTALNEHLCKTDLLINTSSLGMTGQPELSINLSKMKKTALVSDIVYVPLETPLLAQAKALGLATVSGLGMLLHQAAPGFEKWFGIFPEVTDDLYFLIAEDLQKAKE